MNPPTITDPEEELAKERRDFDFFEFVKESYMDHLMDIKASMKGRYEVTQPFLESILAVEDAESTQDTSGKQSVD